MGADDVEVTGGEAGLGGAGIVEAGDGGDGVDAEEPHGAAGGDATATGGKGGDADLKDLDDAKIHDGAQGGDAEFGEPAAPPGAASLRSAGAALARGFAQGVGVAGGNGGDGWLDCIDPDYRQGGNGGNGGVGTGTAGAGGDGKAPGEDGDVILTGPGFNGGDGMDGEPPGALGPKGTDAIAMPRAETGENFTDGEAGDPCKSGIYFLSMSVISDEDGHVPFLGFELFVPGLALQVDPVNNKIMIDGSGAFPAMEGDWDPVTGDIWLFGEATLADGQYPNISFEWHGKLTCNNELQGELTLDGFPPEKPALVVLGVFGGRSTSSAAAPSAVRGCSL